jgi:hypothetical protein
LATAAPESRAALECRVASLNDLIAVDGAPHKRFATFAVGFVMEDCAHLRWTARFACSLLANDVPVVLATREYSVSDLLQGLRGVSEHYAVIGRLGPPADLLALLANDGIVLYAPDGDPEFAMFAARTTDGWRLFDLLMQNNTAAPSRNPAVAVAGLRIQFDVTTGEDRRCNDLRCKLTEAGVRLTDGGDADADMLDIILCRDTATVRPDRPAVGMNLASPGDEPLGMWVQGSALEPRYLPAVGRALETVAATPLNQWRRWLA